MRFRYMFSTLILLAIALTACGPAAQTPSPAMPTSEAMMMHETPTPDAMMDTPGAVVETPGWFGTSLTDVRTGQSFAIHDFKGKVVLVETMAVWCTTCLRQQMEIRTLHTQLGARDDFVSISLDIDPNENMNTLSSYVASKGFDWLYAVSPADMTRAIGQAFGDQFLNPPSAPIFIIDRHGVAHPLPFGVKKADDLMKEIQAYLNDHM